MILKRGYTSVYFLWATQNCSYLIFGEYLLKVLPPFAVLLLLMPHNLISRYKQSYSC